MRFYFTAALVLLCTIARCQKFSIAGKEYMDTTRAGNPACAKATLARYYSVSGKYPRSSETLLREAQEFLRQKKRTYAGSGYVTFRFVVDCAGHRQMLTQVLQTDGQYRPFHFRKELVEDLYGYLQTLTAWQIAKADVPVNYLAYLSFKIQNGKITAVIP